MRFKKVIIKTRKNQDTQKDKPFKHYLKAFKHYDKSRYFIY